MCSDDDFIRSILNSIGPVPITDDEHSWVTHSRVPTLRHHLCRCAVSFVGKRYTQPPH
jgi:hypothetical protein